MRVRCVTNLWQQTKGFFKKTTTVYSDPGITVGKVYEVTPVPVVRGNVAGGTGSVYSYVEFLILNDDGKWRTYNPAYFTKESA